MSDVVSKISEVQVVYFNAIGYETFENVWGTWNGINERDGEALRRVGHLLRYFGRRGFLQSSDWAPFTVEGLQMRQGVFVSAFPSPSGEEVMYAFVNRKMAPSSGPQLLSSKAATPGIRFYDCYRGLELTPDTRTQTLSFEVEGGNPHGCFPTEPRAALLR